MHYLMIIFLGFTFVSCQNLQKENTAQSLFNKAKSLASGGSYIEATEILSQLKYQFPHSVLNQKADLLKADMAFDQREWSQAYEAYRQFIQLYPQHIDRTKAYFQKLLSLHRQMPAVSTRDIKVAQPLIQVANEFLKNYPKSQYAKKVKSIRKQVYNQIAEKEFQIGSFYFNQGQYQATLSRLVNIIQNYSHTRWYVPALKLIIRIAKVTNDVQLEKKYQKKLQKSSHQNQSS